ELLERLPKLPWIELAVQETDNDAALHRFVKLSKLVGEPVLLDVDRHFEPAASPQRRGEGHHLAAAHPEPAEERITFLVGRPEPAEELLDLLLGRKASSIVADREALLIQSHVDPTRSGIDRVHDALKERLAERAGLALDNGHQKIRVHREFQFRMTHR